LLLLVVVTLGCGEKPAPVAGPKPVVEVEAVAEPEPVAEEAKQSPPGPEVGRDAAIAEIEKLGGRVQYDEGNPDRTIVTVDLRGKQVTDAGLEHLKGLTNLRTLHLQHTQVTDAGVNELKKALPNCKISD